MAVTPTSIGSQSTRIDYDAGETAGAILSTIKTVLSGTGWTVHDDAPGGDSDVYVADNRDGTSQKYARLNIASNEIRVEVYEDWDAGTNTGTNLAPFSDTQGAILDLATGGKLWVFVHPRYLALLGEVAGSKGSNGLVGIFERVRANPSDVDGVSPDLPPYIWTGSRTIATGTSYTMPKALASGDTDSGKISWAGLGLSGDGLLTTSQLPNEPDSWSGRNFVMPLSAFDRAPSDSSVVGSFLGEVIGLHGVQRNLGTFFDEITFETDGDALFSAGGTEQTFWIIVGLDGDQGVDSIRLALLK